MRALILLIATLVLTPSASAQQPTAAENTGIVLRAVDGRTGKPLENQHLLLFGGPSVQAAREHQKQYEVVTGTGGIAALDLSADTRWLQVWVDWHVLCATKNPIFSVADILATGVNAPNACGSRSAQEKTTPGHLVVFARSKRFWEKMRQ